MANAKTCCGCFGCIVFVLVREQPFDYCRGAGRFLCARFFFYSRERVRLFFAKVLGYRARLCLQDRLKPDYLHGFDIH